MSWRPALDEVWGFVPARRGALVGRHNVFVYHDAVPPDDEIIVDFGAEVAGAFDSKGDLQLTYMRAREVVSTLHVGPISNLGAAEAAIEAWRVAHVRRFAGNSWETYGDWAMIRRSRKAGSRGCSKASGRSGLVHRVSSWFARL